MQLQIAERKRAKIKMGLQGPSGSGKTYSALLLAYGLCDNWSKIALIDSENCSGNLYAHLGKYNVIDIQAPFSPEKYVEAIQFCEQQEMEVIIIDSISHEWEGIGGLLEVLNNMVGNSYTNWNKLTPRHNSFIRHILQSPAHIIGTIRSKQDYVLSEKNGKMVPEKIGLKGVTREGLDYEFTLLFELDINHNCRVTKDRTSLFSGKPDFVITSDIGKRILAWCNEPPESDQKGFLHTILRQIHACETVEELLTVYRAHPEVQTTLLLEFSRKRQRLSVSNDLKQITHTENLQTNGTTNK